MSRTACLLLVGCSLSVGCHAPMPRARDLFMPPGSTRISPPATGSFSTPDSYYPGAAAPNVPPVPSYQPPPAPPQATTSGAGRGLIVPGAQPRTNGTGALSPPGGGTTHLPAPPNLEIGRGIDPPRVRISREATRGVSHVEFAGPAAASTDGMAATTVQPSEPRGFQPPAQMLEISQLPPPSRPALSGRPRTTATLGGGDAGPWESRR